MSVQCDLSDPATESFLPCQKSRLTSSVCPARPQLIRFAEYDVLLLGIRHRYGGRNVKPMLYLPGRRDLPDGSSGQMAQSGCSRHDARLPHRFYIRNPLIT